MRIILLCLLSVVIVSFSACEKQSVDVTKEKVKPKKRAGRMPPVVIAKAKKQWLAPLSWVAGTVISLNDAKLSTEVEGQLKRVAQVGKKVKRGEVIAEIDSTFVKLSIEELSAAVEKERAQLTFYQQEVKRLNRLAKQNNAAQTRLEQNIADREIAQNELNIANSRLQRAREQLKRHFIRAPFAGVVSQRLKRPGERAKEGDNIIHLIDTQSMEIQARAPLSSVNFVSEGAVVNIKHRSQGSIEEATIRALVPIGDERSRMMDIRLDLPKNNWRVGQSVRVALPNAKPREVLAVPRDALVLRRDGASIFRLKEDDSAEKLTVKLGIAAGNLIEVMGGLQDNDRVVIRGGERLRPGQKVRIIEASGSL